MPARPPVDTRGADLRRLQIAARIAHGSWDPYREDPRLRTVFRSFGRFRWLVVPLAALAFALFVGFVGFLAGAPPQF